MKNSQKGFTLLEVIISIALFVSVAMAVWLSNHNSLQAIITSRDYFLALQAAESKMAEIEIKLQRSIDANAVESSYTEEEGTFDAPYEKFKFKWVFREFPLEFTPQTLSETLKQLGVDSQQAEQQLESNSLIIKNSNNAFKKQVGELELEVFWTLNKRTERLKLMTHLMPKKPKLEILLDGGTP